MAYLFDTDAISETLKRRPASAYVSWLSEVPREDQYTSAISIGELFKGAYRSSDRERHLRNVEQRVLPRLTILPYDIHTAREYGRIRATLEERGDLLPDADLQIASTAILHGLRLVTCHVKHFERIDGLDLEFVLANTRDR